jgi:hypothetical protein
MTSTSVAPSEDVIDGLLSPEGWAYASTDSIEEGDPGRFHALFGRDSLIFALQMLDSRPEIAAATLRGLATRQGTSDDPAIDEQPGKIIHEYRPVAPDWMVEADWPVRDGGITARRMRRRGSSWCWRPPGMPTSRRSSRLTGRRPADGWSPPWPPAGDLSDAGRVRIPVG